MARKKKLPPAFVEHMGRMKGNKRIPKSQLPQNKKDKKGGKKKG